MTNTRDRWIGAVCLAGFIGCVFLANYSIEHWGDLAFPGGPHTVTLLGFTAPSGVLFVGLSFTLRDGAQLALGRWWVLAAIAVGAGLSALVAPAELALGSGLAFLVGETFDWAVFTPLAERGYWLGGVVLSNTIGSLVDSVVFLSVAFGSLAFLEGQFVLKVLMTVPFLLALAPFRLRQVRH